MKSLLTRDIPPRATAVVVALVLLAGVVTGRDESPADQPQPVALPEPSTQASPVKEQAVPSLELDKLQRERKAETVANLFAPKGWTPTSPPAPPVITRPSTPPAPPAPTVPPLPYRYLGRLADTSKAIVFIGKNEENSYAVTVGDTLEDTYRIDSITETAIKLMYLPLGIEQSLPIPSPGREGN